MINSRRFINFAFVSLMGLISTGLSSCQGRTMENMEPTGDTIEVVILQETNVTD